MDSKHIPAIQKRILLVDGTPVILDSDLAQLYGVETKALNRAVSRNMDRFPEDFSFKLSTEDWENLKYQFGTSSLEHGGRRKLPRVFTEHGALMASTILRSEEAVKMSTFIIRAFVKMREELASNREVLKRLAEIDKSLLLHDTALRDLYQKILPLLQSPPDPPKRDIGFRVEESGGRAYRTGRKPGRKSI